MYEDNRGSGCNDDWTAIRVAIGQLLDFAEKNNKILIVFTDGRPNGHSSGTTINGVQYNEPDALHKMIQIATSYGITVVGVGLAYEDGIKEYYPQHVFIDDINQLPDAVASIVKTAIMKNNL
jgi:nitric oxide reductase activation protein